MLLLLTSLALADPAYEVLDRGGPAPIDAWPAPVEGTTLTTVTTTSTKVWNGTGEGEPTSTNDMAMTLTYRVATVHGPTRYDLVTRTDSMEGLSMTPATPESLLAWREALAQSAGQEFTATVDTGAQQPPPFDKPMGPGARWSMVDQRDENGTTISTTTLVEVVSWTDAQMTVRTDSTSVVHSETEGDWPVRTDTTTTVQSTSVMVPGQPAPLRSDMQSTTDTFLLMLTPDGPQKTVTHTETTSTTRAKVE